MRFALIVVALVACRGKSERIEKQREAAQQRPHDAMVVIDAPVCPGKIEDCAACEAGKADACTRIALETSSPVSQHRWYKRGCELGSITGCEGLAHTYSFGTGVPRDPEAADKARARQQQLELAQHDANVKKCEALDEEACADVGIDLAVGRVVTKDVKAGLAVLGASCKRGAAKSCAAAAEVAESAKDKAMYAMAACAAGEQRTCGDLVGVFGEEPLARGQDAFAKRELDRMCRTKDALACWVLGAIFWTARDKARAKVSLELACSLDAKWCDERDRFGRGEKFIQDVPLPTLDLPGVLDAGIR